MTGPVLAGALREQLLAVVTRRLDDRNAVTEAFFRTESKRLAVLASEAAARFGRDGRLLAFGTGAMATDAQHIAVEFMHPVIVGKRALPALDISADRDLRLRTGLQMEDVVVGLSAPQGDPDIERALKTAAARGALAIGLPGRDGRGFPAASNDPFVHQEVCELLYHALWESVHVFLEREPIAESGGGAASFLYPFLSPSTLEGPARAETLEAVAASIREKAAYTMRLRSGVALGQGEPIVDAAAAIVRRLEAGGVILCVGNGGSATDATDFALDLTAGGDVPAVSLASDPAVLTAIANDIGVEAVFQRQIIALARPPDVVVAFSTSGGSENVQQGLIEARARGLLTVAIVGYQGGEIGRLGLADYLIAVHSDQIPRVQEVQGSIAHVLVGLIGAIRGNR